jgi:hypothetical protein
LLLVTSFYVSALLLLQSLDEPDNVITVIEMWYEDYNRRRVILHFSMKNEK